MRPTQAVGQNLHVPLQVHQVCNAEHLYMATAKMSIRESEAKNARVWHILRCDVMMSEARAIRRPLSTDREKTEEPAGHLSQGKGRDTDD